MTSYEMTTRELSSFFSGGRQLRNPSFWDYNLPTLIMNMDRKESRALGATQAGVRVFFSIASKSGHHW
jgi:hypothetical protein